MDNRDKIRVCRLCLKKVTENYEPITEIVQLNLNFLMVHPNIALRDNPVMCETCAVTLKKCYDFKANCLSAEDSIASFIKNEGGKVDLRDIYAKLKLDGNKDGMPEDRIVCRFCVKLVKVKENSITSLKYKKSTLSMLEKYFMELDLTITDDIIACKPCYKSLQRNISFINNYLIMKEQISGFYKAKTRNQNRANTFTSKDVKKEEVESESMEDASSKIKLEDQMEFQYRTYSDVYKCDQCDYQSKYKKWLENHVSTHLNGPRKFKCELCSYEAKHKCHLETHMMTHKNSSELQLYGCANCDYQAKRKGDLKRHMIVHRSVSQLKPYKCPVCIYETRHKNCLQQHMLTHRSSSEIVMHECELCPFKTKRNRDLRRHLLSHKNPSTATIHKCTKCTFETKSIRHLRNHQLKHSGDSQEELYKCEHCDYQTRRKYDFNLHVVIHRSPSEVPMYKCETCGYETRHASYIPRHIQMHKRYMEAEMLKCDFCEYETRRKGDLQRHLISHTSKRGEGEVETRDS